MYRIKAHVASLTSDDKSNTLECLAYHFVTLQPRGGGGGGELVIFRTGVCHFMVSISTLS